jgi:hypothetical protein
VLLGQATHPRRGKADRGQSGEAAGAVAEALKLNEAAHPETASRSREVPRVSRSQDEQILPRIVFMQGRIGCRRLNCPGVLQAGNYSRTRMDQPTARAASKLSRGFDVGDLAISYRLNGYPISTVCENHAADHPPSLDRLARLIHDTR